MSTREPITPATTVLDILARQAAEHREHARQRGIAAQDAKDPLTDAAHAMSVTRKAIEDIQKEIAELEARLRVAESEHADATARHADALAAHADHEAEAQQAADIAESLDRIAAQMRGQAPVPPAEALAATGLMPPKEVDPGPVSATLCQDNGLPMVWDSTVPPGGYVCAVPDGEDICGRPVESEPCDRHGPDDAPPAPREPVATPPVPTAPAGDLVATSGPLTTMPDVGLNPRRLDPPPGAGHHSHAKPGLGSRITGGFKALLDKPEPADEQQGDGENGGGQ